MKPCSRTWGASVLHLLWTFSIVAGSRSWIYFFLPLLKGQGNMKPQKANSSLCHISVSPQGNIAMVFLMLFFSSRLFNPQSLAQLVTAHTVTHSHIILLSCFWWILGAPERVPTTAAHLWWAGGRYHKAWPHHRFSGSSAACSQSTVFGTHTRLVIVKL